MSTTSLPHFRRRSRCPAQLRARLWLQFADHGYVLQRVCTLVVGCLFRSCRRLPLDAER